MLWNELEGHWQLSTLFWNSEKLKMLIRDFRHLLLLEASVTLERCKSDMMGNEIQQASTDF